MQLAATFEEAILENVDDDAPYMVYADWLMANSDPRGELIMLQHELDEASGPRKATLKRAANAHLEKYAAQFVGSTLADHEAVWRYGFIRKLDMQVDDKPLDVIAAAVQHPSCQFMIELQVGCVFDEWGELDFQGVIDTLAALRKPAALRTLDLGVTRGYTLDTEFGDFKELIAALPRLRRIRLRERRYDKPRPDDPLQEMIIQRSRK